jgi:hypothetical protein
LFRTGKSCWGCFTELKTEKIEAESVEMENLGIHDEEVIVNEVDYEETIVVTENGSLVSSAPSTSIIDIEHQSSFQHCTTYLFSCFIVAPFKLVTSFLALDWLYLKFGASAMSSMCTSYRNFLTKDHFCDLTKDFELTNVSCYAADRSRLDRIRREISALVLPEIPWLLGMSDVRKKLMRKDGTNLEECRNEKLIWKKEQKKFPAFTLAAQKVRCEMHRNLRQFFSKREDSIRTARNREDISQQKIFILNVFMKCVDPLVYCLTYLLCYPCSYFFLFQLSTTFGQVVWRRIVNNYLSIFELAAGYWTEEAVDNFNVIQDYENFSALMKDIDDQMEQADERDGDLMNTLESGDAMKCGLKSLKKKQHDDVVISTIDSDTRRNLERDSDEHVLLSPNSLSDSTSTSKTTSQHFQESEEAFLKVLNDPKFTFQYFLAAIVSVRVVLLQVVPILTIPSIIAVEIANCPILVFSERLNKRLPPLLVEAPFEEAQRLLLEDAKNADLNHVPKWKIIALGFFMFVRQSRLIQFLFLPINSFTMIVIAFSPQRYLLYFMLIVVVLEFTILGLAYAAWLLLVFHRWMFPIALKSVDDCVVSECDSNTAVHHCDGDGDDTARLNPKE